MSSLAPAVGIVLVAALTPGPNNLVVLRAAAGGGMRAAVPAITGAVAGGILLLTATTAGADRVLSAAPGVRIAITLAGAAYLALLGLWMIVRPDGFAPKPAEAGPTRAAAAMFAFQLMNPKAWVMAVTVTAGTPHAFAPLVIVFASIPAACLVLWAAFGAYGARRWRGTSLGRTIERGLGVALLASALALIGA